MGVTRTQHTDCLLVVYDFPPEGGVKAHRAAKFAKYLPGYGYRPVVYTTRKPVLMQPDPSLAADLSGVVEVVRSPLCSPYSPYRALRELWGDLRPGGSAGGGPPASARSRALDLASRVMFPDAMFGWRLISPLYFPDIIAAGAPRVVWASAPPFSALLVGRYFARKLGVPFVADIRDMYCDNPHNPPQPHFAARARELERRVLTEAARVIVVTQGIATTLEERYGLGDRLAVIHNGFDFEPHATPVPACPPLRIGHIGSVVRSSGRDFDSFFQAWEILKLRAPDVASALHFTQVGLMDRGNLRAWEHYVQALGVQSQVEHVPPVPQREAVARLPHFNLLLLHNSGGIAHGGFDPTALSTKIFEYLAINRKILALGGEGEAATLIRKHCAGWVAPYDQPDRIASTLEDIYASASAGGLERPIDPAVMAYHRKSQTGELAKLLDSLLQSSPGSRNST